MRNEKRFTMISPQPGFTARVMTRVAEQERTQTRRAWLGSALLVIAAIAILSAIVWWIASWVSVFVTTPQLLVALINAFVTLAFWTTKFAQVVWDVALTVADKSGALMPVLALVAFALTIVWVRVVAGPFRRIPQKQIVGGLR